MPGGKFTIKYLTREQTQVSLSDTGNENDSRKISDDWVKPNKGT